MGEIDLRIASLDEPCDPSDDPADVLPESPTSPPVSKIGDLWQLNQHRVFCGNALDATAFAALMSDDRASMVCTDPPYNVPIDRHASGLGAIHHRPFPMASGEMDRPEFTAFLRAAFRNLAEFSSMARCTTSAWQSRRASAASRGTPMDRVTDSRPAV